MIIKSLKLQNYRRFKELAIEFPENLIGIIGRNGVGKSTIIEAVGWVLYGNRFVRTDKQDVRSQHAEEKSDCLAEMVFVYGGSEYRIERKLKGKNAISEASVWRLGESTPVAVQDRGVNDFIEGLLLLDYRSFTTSVFAQQKELAKLSTLQPEQRRQAINRLINIDRIDRARDLVRRDRNEKLAFLSGKKTMLKDADEIKTRQKELHVRQAEKEKQKSELQAEVENISHQLHAARETFESINKCRDQFLNWETQIGKLYSRLVENEKNLARAQGELHEIKIAENELSELVVQLRDLDAVKSAKLQLENEREKLNHLNSRLKEKQLVQASLDREQKNSQETKAKAQDCDRLQQTLAILSSDLEVLEKKITAVLEKIKTAHGLKTTAESNGQELKHKLDRIQKLGPDSECPVCTRRLGDHFSIVVTDHNEQLANLRVEFVKYRDVEQAAVEEQKELQKQLGHKRSEREEALKKLKTAQDAAELVDKIHVHIVNYENQLALIETAISEIGPVVYDEHQHNKVKIRYENLLSIQQHAAKLEERAARRLSVESYIESTTKEVSSIQGDLDSARSAQAALGFDENDYSRAKRGVDERTTELNHAKDLFALASQEFALLVRDIENSKKELTEQKRLAKDIKETEEEIFYLNALDDYFSQFRLELAGRIRPLIAQRASELLRLTTASRYTLIDLDLDYNIKIYDGNLAFPIERFSGGEQDLANLCLRVAISQVVAERSGGAPINFIVLDEIFGSQDSERRDLILNALAQLSSQFRQIFIITHIETIKDVLPVLLNVEMQDEMTSRVVQL